MANRSLEDVIQEAAKEDAFEYHGCFTGDCPHMEGKECAIHFYKAGAELLKPQLIALAEALDSIMNEPYQNHWVDVGDDTTITKVNYFARWARDRARQALARLDEFLNG